MKFTLRFLSIILALMVFIPNGQAQKQKKVQTFTVSKVIKAPAAEVWRVIGEDYGAIAHSHPTIIASDYESGSLKGGEGAQRYCAFNESGTRYLKEMQTEFDAANYTFKNKVYEAGKFPVNPDYTYAIYKVEPIDDTQSKFIFDMTYRTKPAFMGGMARGKFKKLINDYMISVEHHIKTGESVTKDNFKGY